MSNKAYELAQAEVGTVEWAQGDNPKVVAYFKDAGHSQVTNDETAWCAAFVGAMLKRAGFANTKSLLARSYLVYGKEVQRKDAQPGDIVVFSRGNSTWQGHVAFFVKDHGAFLEVLGGNQANAVNKKKYQAKQLLGIRRPVKAVVTDTRKPVPTPAPLPPAQAPSKPAVIGGLLAAAAATGAAIWQWGAEWVDWLTFWN